MVLSPSVARALQRDKAECLPDKLGQQLGAAAGVCFVLAESPEQQDLSMSVCQPGHSRQQAMLMGLQQGGQQLGGHAGTCTHGV